MSEQKISLNTPIGRWVQGALELRAQTDDDDKPVLNQDGTQRQQLFMALAIEKTNPEFAPFWSQVVAVARANYPQFVDANGNCSHPQFSWKLQDGDGVDKNGKSVKDKPGFAGHWIIKCTSQFMPKCFHEGRFDATQQIQEPHNVIKRGNYIRMTLNVAGNGVAASDTKKKPGIIMSPQIVSLVGYHPDGEIQGGIDASVAMAQKAQYVPAGLSQTPTVGGGASTQPPNLGSAMPNLGAAPTGMPNLGATPTAMPVIGAQSAMPVINQEPQWEMLPAANGYTREQLMAANPQWTDELMVANGLMRRR